MEDTGHSRRSTFVIDQQGTVRWTYHAELSEQRDVNGILEALEEIKKG
jgi:peroxiredoxin